MKIKWINIPSNVKILVREVPKTFEKYLEDCSGVYDPDITPDEDRENRKREYEGMKGFDICIGAKVVDEKGGK